METFESEYQKLFKWYKEQLEETKKLPYQVKGHDGSERNIAEKKIDYEYRQHFLLNIVFYAHIQKGGNIL